MPRSAHDVGPQEPAPLQRRLGEQVFRPVAQPAAKPGRQGYRESGLRPIDQNRLGRACRVSRAGSACLVCGHLQAVRLSSRLDENLAVEEWCSQLQADGHARPIDFRQDVVGKISLRIKQHCLAGK